MVIPTSTVRGGDHLLVDFLARPDAGDLDAARELAEQNIRELAELARDGCPIVCTEPAAALCLSAVFEHHPLGLREIVGCIIIIASMGSGRVIALLRLQRLAVSFRFEGVDEAARLRFMQHFDLSTQRGGG